MTRRKLKTLAHYVYYVFVLVLTFAALIGLFDALRYAGAIAHAIANNGGRI